MTPISSGRPSPAALRFPRSTYLALAGACLTLSARAQSGTIPERPTIVEPAPDDPRVAQPVLNVEGAAQAETPPAPDLTRLELVESERLYYGTEEDGSPAALAATYKARFGPEGAVYTPFLGSAAPRDYPVAFRVASASIGDVAIPFDAGARAVRVADEIRYERGGLVEVYDLRPDAIEQRFVFDALPGAGELVVRVSAATDLVAREVEEGFRFENELGAVRYGRATALDADGRRVTAPTTLTDAGIEIRVPADFVAQARLPLVIDPVISVFAVDTAAPTAFSPDCAYDFTTNRWLVVHEEIFSMTDHDVVWRLIGVLNGQSFGSGYVDTSLGHYWANPACANNNAMDRFFVAAEVGVPGQVNRRILGKTIDASTGTFGTELNIGSEDPFVDLYNADVGGDPHGGLPSYFMVVWEKTYNSTDHDLYYRMVDPGNSLAGGMQIVDISAQTIDTAPSISKSNDGSTWNLVWQRQTPDNVLRGARVGWNGLALAGSFPIPNTLFFGQEANTLTPTASTCLNGTQTWAVAFSFASGFFADDDLGLILLDASAVLDEANVSEMEGLQGSQTLALSQNTPDIDSDGRSFAVAYVERYYDNGFWSAGIRVATVAVVGNQLQLSEGHAVAGDLNAVHPSIASTDGAGLPWRLHLIVHDDPDDGSGLDDGDIVGALYDSALFASFCHPTYPGVPACPCGNPPGAYGRGCNNSANTGGAQAVADGISSVGSDTMGLHSYYMPATAITIFGQGNAVLANGVAFGQGIRCAGGSILRLYIKSAEAGVAHAPLAGDPNIHARSAALGDPISAGQTRSYFAYYRDQGVLGGCPSTSTFNTTQSVQAIWIP